MNIKSKWYAQIEILEKFKKKLEKKLEEYNNNVPMGNDPEYDKHDSKSIELENVISELEEEIYDIQEHGINCLRDEQR